MRRALVAQIGQQALFVARFCIILSMYGGGFATVPAYLADMFGTQFVGAIHGRLLTAWSTAGIIGPVVVNYIREAQTRCRRAARPSLRRHHVHPGRHAGDRLHLQLPDQAGQSQVVHEPGGGLQACRPRAPKRRTPSHLLASARADSIGKLACSGLLSAFPSPGACGQR